MGLISREQYEKEETLIKGSPLLHLLERFCQAANPFPNISFGD